MIMYGCVCVCVCVCVCAIVCVCVCVCVCIEYSIRIEHFDLFILDGERCFVIIGNSCIVWVAMDKQLFERSFRLSSLNIALPC